MLLHEPISEVRFRYLFFYKTSVWATLNLLLKIRNSYFCYLYDTFDLVAEWARSTVGISQRQAPNSHIGRDAEPTKRSGGRDKAHPQSTAMDQSA